MKRIVILGNSGSGKSTLAKSLSKSDNLRHLDLDTLAWLPGSTPRRKPLAESESEIASYLRGAVGWVVEGCYCDLLEVVVPRATELIYMDLSVEDCLANARTRPWEPHKYSSKAAQDENLPMLLDWISEYEHRSDCFSKAAHEKLFMGFPGKKRRFTSNQAAIE